MVGAALIMTLIAGHAADSEADESPPADVLTLNEERLDVAVCLRDGQRLFGSNLYRGDPFRLELAGAYVTIPKDSWAPSCRQPWHWTQGRPDKIRIFELPGDQRLYGTSKGAHGLDVLVVVLNHDPVFVPSELVLHVTVPERDDPVVVSARRHRPVVVAVVIGGVVLSVAAAAGLVVLLAQSGGGCMFCYF